MKRSLLIVPVVLLFLGGCGTIGGSVVGSLLGQSLGAATGAFEDKVAARAAWTAKRGDLSANIQRDYMDEASRIKARENLSDEDVADSNRRIAALEGIYAKARAALEDVMPQFMYEKIIQWRRERRGDSDPDPGVPE